MISLGMGKASGYSWFHATDVTEDVVHTLLSEKNSIIYSCLDGILYKSEHQKKIVLITIYVSHV